MLDAVVVVAVLVHYSCIVVSINSSDVFNIVKNTPTPLGSKTHYSSSITVVIT